MALKMLLPVVTAIAFVADAAGAGVIADDDVSAMLQAKVTLTEAIATAEKEAGGKAVSASIDDNDGALLIGVVVAQSDRTQKVLIDAQTGKVVKVNANGEDGDDGEEDDDEEDGDE